VYLFTDATGGDSEFRDTSGGAGVLSVTISDGTTNEDFFYYEETAGAWTITASDATPADGNVGIDDATDNLTVTPDTSGIGIQFILDIPGSITQGDEITCTVFYTEQYGNPIPVDDPSGELMTYLYTTSGEAEFRDSSGGAAITEVAIINGTTFATFWYWDNQVGTSTLTVSDAAPADGVLGVNDATRDLAVESSETRRPPVVPPTPPDMPGPPDDTGGVDGGDNFINTGFDDNTQIVNIWWESGRRRYEPDYDPGRYRTAVIVYEGKVVAAPYDESGPRFAEGIYMTAGQSATIEETVYKERGEKRVRKIKVTVIVPDDSIGEFVVTPYDESGLKLDEIVVLTSGDAYTDVREVEMKAEVKKQKS